MNAPLELTGLTRVFQTPAGPLIAVKDVNAHVHAGELVAIIGHSGCGKSTVLSMIAGLDRATLGRVVVDGREVTAPGLERAMVFQRPCLLPWLSALQNVGLAVAQRADVSAGQRALLAREHLERVGIEGAANERPSELSLGTRQCVALARALALEPRFLLLDEPFGALDAKVRQELRGALRSIHDKLGLTSIFVTHDREEAFALADRIAILNNGGIEQYGAPDDIAKSPATEFVRDFLE